jgi:hypothetical protein
MQPVQAPVRHFTMTPPQLIELVDEITDRAAQVLALGGAAMATASGDARASLASLLEHVKHIGFMADSSVADCSVDLRQVWGIAQRDERAGQPDAT